MPIKQVLLGDQILHGQDRAGQWVVEKLTGWYEAPQSKGDGGERPLADGDYEAQRFYGPRMVTVDGILFHKGRGQLVSAREQLNVRASLNKHDLVVTDAGLTRRLVVKALGVDWIEATRDASRFQVRLRADDPRKFGDSQRFSGSVGAAFDVYQRGAHPATPVVTVSGSMPSGYDLTLNGRLVTVTKGLSSGSTHTIDMRTGILRQNGVVVAGGFSYSELLKVNAGLPQSFYSVAASGSGTVRLDYYDTYM